MWYFKQTAKTIWQVSKGMVVDNRSKVKKLLDQIALSEEQIISTNKLNQLAALTYDMETFQQTLQEVLKRLKTFQYDIDEARKNHNVLIATNYLLKHGASGFVDQLRSYINVFKKYQTLKDLKTYQDEVLQKQLSYELQKIKSRARHIQVLLQDKQKLLKQKQLAMLIKQKMKLYQKSTTQSLNNDNRKQRIQKQKSGQTSSKYGSIQHQSSNKKSIKDYSDKIDGYLQKYLWKYVDKLDDKIQVISQKVMQNFDKYIIGELPANFQPQSLEQQQQNQKQASSSGKKMKKTQQYVQYKQLEEANAQYKQLDEDDDLMKKLEQEGQNATGVNTNLIDFQQVNQKDSQENSGKKTNQQSLI